MGLRDYVNTNPDKGIKVDGFGDKPNTEPLNASASYTREDTAAYGNKYDKGAEVFRPVTRDELEKNQAVHSSGNPLDQLRETKVDTKPDVADRLNKGEDLYSALLANNYEQSEADLKRQRTADFWGNVAKVFGQGIASTAGVRQFTPVENKTPYYNDQLMRLRQSYRDANLQQSLLEKRYDMQNKAEQQKLQLQYAKEAQLAVLKSGLESGQIDKRLAGQIQLAVQKAGDDKELEAVKNKYKLRQIDAQGKNTMKVAAYHESHADSRAKLAAETSRANKGEKDNETIVVSRQDNKTGKVYKEVVTYPKEKRGALISLYNRLRQLAEEKNDKSIPDLQLQFGEGGDQASKAMTTIQNRLQDFPDLTEEFDKIVNSGKSAYDPGAYKRGKSNNKPRLE